MQSSNDFCVGKSYELITDVGGSVIIVSPVFASRALIPMPLLYPT
jgi:hypothetical protein